jgi:hypothetical protein
MQADVKTAKDIPLALFMELKSQYESEMGKTGELGHKNGGGMSYGAVGRDSYAAVSGNNKNCEGGIPGRQGCGMGCSKYLVPTFLLICYLFRSHVNRKLLQKGLSQISRDLL